MTIGLLAIFSSCSDSNDEEVKVQDPKLLTFSFTVEDNQGIISEDYTVNVTSTNIEFTMPAFVDKSKLVATFTTNEDNVVLVDGVTQENGVTVNDYTVPVDFIVSNGKTNVKYTVTIAKASNMEWSSLSTFAATTLYGGAKLKVNPTDGTPYLGFKIRENENYKMSVVKWNNTNWEAVGPSDGFGSQVSSSYFDFSFDKDGTPYVVYSDQSTSPIAGAASLMKWSGSSWDYVGSQGFIEAQSQKISMAISNDGQIFVGQINNSRNSSYARNAFVLSTNAGSWANSELPLLASGSPVYLCDMASVGDKVYLALLNRGTVNGVRYGHSVYEYENGQWTALLDNYLEPNATQTSIVMLNMAVGADGSVYLLTGDDAATTGSYQLRLRKYDSQTQAWSTVGGNPFGITLSTHSSAVVAVAPDGTPFVAYKDEADQDYPKVVYLDSETKQWSTPVKLADVAADGLDMVFSSTGIGYVVFTDTDQHAVVCKYDIKK